MRSIVVSAARLSAACLIVFAAIGWITPVQAASGDWTEYLGNAGKSGYNGAETVITPATAPNLALRWTASSNSQASTQTVTAYGNAYWGTWDGYERATNASTGAPLWSTFLGQAPECNRQYKSGITDTPKVATEWVGGHAHHMLWIGGGDAAMYALNADTGQVLWRTLLDSEFGAFIWSSPTLYNGNIYVGLSSFSDCPLVHGGVFELNAMTGAIEHVFYTEPDGCVGGSVWGSPAIDYVTGRLYVATGNPGSCSSPNTPTPYVQALVDLNASDLSVVGSWQVPASQQIEDGDFGSTPTLFSAAVNGSRQYLVGVANKNGIYYAFNRYNVSAGPVWEDQIATPGPPDTGYGSISPSAWDGNQLYVAGGKTTVNGLACIASVRAVDPATGHFVWENCINTGQSYGGVLGAVMASPGIVAVTAGLQLRVVASSNGATLFKYTDKSIFYSAPTISNGALYVPDTYGNLRAFSPPVSTGAVARFRVVQKGSQRSLRWVMAEAVGIKGFRLFGSHHRLNRHLLKPRRSLVNTFRLTSKAHGPFRLEVLAEGGKTVSVRSKP